MTEGELNEETSEFLEKISRLSNEKRIEIGRWMTRTITKNCAEHFATHGAELSARKSNLRTVGALGEKMLQIAEKLLDDNGVALGEERALEWLEEMQEIERKQGRNVLWVQRMASAPTLTLVRNKRDPAQGSEQLRWLILLTLNAARPLGANEHLVLHTVQAVPLAVTQYELRRQADYLQERGLINVSNQHTGVWYCELTHGGIDVVGYAVECDSGIARPKKYW